MAVKLHDLEVSGNCYKVRLLCALLNVPVELIPVDFPGGAHKKSPLIELNPFGQLPILEDGDVVVRNSQTILVYVARKWRGVAADRCYIAGARCAVADGGRERDCARSRRRPTARQVRL